MYEALHLRFSVGISILGGCPMAKIEPITIGTLNLTGIENLPKVVNQINQSIDRIQSAGDEHIGEILREIGQAVIVDSRLEKGARQAIVMILRTLAHEASLSPAKRNPEVVKTTLAFIPALMDTSLDVLNYFHVHLDDLREFFGIPA